MDSVTKEMQAIDQAEVDVDYQGVEENLGSEPEEKLEEKDVVDILEPKAAHKEWVIGQGEYERTYIQKPLSFIAKMQWFSLVGEVMDKAMTGENALTLSTLMETPGQRGQQLSVNDFRDADTFVHAISKIMVYAPDFLAKSWCIWLAVPLFERELVSEVMALPEEEGGVTDEMAFELAEIFLDQNAEALDRFFREKLPSLQKRLQARLQRET